ncbi:reverse transcriptase domain-containing protein [Tanacetum coccineum]
MLTNPKKLGRIAKWAIEVGEHDIEFRERGSTQREILKDFLVEMTSEENKRAAAESVIKEIHEGSCGFNTKPRSMVVKVTKHGYYWPSMYRDAAKIIKDCTQCQEQSMATKVSEKGAIVAETTWPFSPIWGGQILRTPTNSHRKLEIPIHIRGALHKMGRSKAFDYDERKASRKFCM